jgi:hypothetical protein
MTAHDPPLPPAELCGGLATLWSAGAPDQVVKEAIRRIVADNSWPAGHEFLDSVQSEAARTELVRRCWDHEKEATAVDGSGQTQKRARTFDF